MNITAHTFITAGIFAIATSSSAAVINAYSSVDGTNMFAGGGEGLTLTVGDSATTPGTGQELIVTGDPPNNWNGKIRHQSLSGTGQGLFAIDTDAETFELTYEIFLPTTGKNFKRDVPRVKFYENFGLWAGGGSQEIVGYNDGADQSVTGAYQTVSYTGIVPTGFDANYAQFEIHLEQGNGAGESGNLSAFIRNVEFNVTTIPEPASLALLGLGGLCLLARRQSRD
ncbi:MAG: PEP-CTERM sorting domain-containing protein [Algisphaera sp.]